MSSSQKGGMFILSSPSGAGKTTLVKKISNRKKFKISISHTTRKPRVNERNGKDYFFVSNQEFERLINNDEFFCSLCFKHQTRGLQGNLAHINHTKSPFLIRDKSPNDEESLFGLK